jgi:hypothetical protein
MSNSVALKCMHSHESLFTLLSLLPLIVGGSQAFELPRYRARLACYSQNTCTSHKAYSARFIVHLRPGRKSHSCGAQYLGTFIRHRGQHLLRNSRRSQAHQNCHVKYLSTSGTAALTQKCLLSVVGSVLFVQC